MKKSPDHAELKALQGLMAQALFRPLTAAQGMQPRWIDGRPMSEVAAGFIKPNDRLTSFERLEIYNRGYWFRVLDSLYDDFPGLRAVLGERRFMRLISAYLAAQPSRSFTMRNLGDRLEAFQRAEPAWTAPREQLALDMTRFEWAQILAFDEGALPVITPAELQAVAPDALRLGLQPYLSLLCLDYAVDDYLLAVKEKASAALRGAASNAIAAFPGGAGRARPRLRLPRRGRVHLAVHRQENQIFFKRLDAPAFAILTALRRGSTVLAACDEALQTAAGADPAWTQEIQGWFQTWTALGWFCPANAGETEPNLL